jgi:2-C-methyl-D-erythritol 4-phosphate cytidylyltransferase
MGSDVPKQFIELNDEPIIIKTIRCFLNYNTSIRIIISVHPDFKGYLENLINISGFDNVNIHITVGGVTRFDSVKNGLQLIHDADAIVGIHDAARPFVSSQTIHNCFETAAKSGNAIPCVAVHESIRKVSSEKSQAVNREDFKIVQTPQCFLVSDIQAAFLQPYHTSFTDDASVLEAVGGTIHLVDGNVENIKITTPQDLIIAKAFVNHDQR